MANIRQLPSGSYNAQVRIKGQPQKSKTFPTEREAQAWAKQQEAVSKEHKTHTIYTLGMAYRESRLKGRGSYGQALVIIQQLHILANNVTDTLLGVHAQAHGWEFEPSPFTPNFDGYNCPVTIYPMVTGDRWSKSLCLTTPDGKVQDKWSDEVQGKKLLDNLYEHAKGKPVLVFAHSWMNYQHPVNGHECNIDSRGLNNLKGYQAAACFQHGNMSPDDVRSLETLSEMMGVASARIREALTYERFYESSLQCFLRTAIRDRDNQSHVSLFAQNEDMANHLKGCLGRTAFIDTSLAHSPYPRAKSDEVMAKKALRDQAQYLVIEHGLSRSDIAKMLNQPLGTVLRWTKGLKQAA
jgi:hypothetical protein